MAVPPAQRGATSLHVVIVGGGIIGSATAWFLAQEHGARVTVLERDFSYAQASSALSVCSIRQQFSTPVNVLLSQWSLLFYRDIATRLGLGDDAPALGLVEPGYLYLAATDAGAERLRAQCAMQHSLGAHTELLSAGRLRERFPWMCCDDVRVASLGLSTATSGEGWFDGYAALQAFRLAAVRAGVEYREEAAVDFVVGESADERGVQGVQGVQGVRGVQGGQRVHNVRTASGDVVAADAVVIAAGAWSAPLGHKLGVPLPVRARKRDVFAFEASDEAANAPLVIDPGGVWFRPEVQPGRYLCGAPPRHGDPDDAPLDRVDHGLFDEVIWPLLAARVPAFDALRVTARWSGYYEMNTFDQNGLVGALPGWGNVFTACGFSGHGLQQAPAVGRGLAERIMLGRYRDLDLDLAPLDPVRVASNRPLREVNII